MGLTVSVREAAELLHWSDAKVRALVRAGVVEAVQSVSQETRQRGRPSSIALRRSDVDRLRQAELDRIGAAEPCPPTCPRRQDSSTPADDRLDEITALRAEVADLREALRLSLVADAVRLDQLRLLLPEQFPV